MAMQLAQEQVNALVRPVTDEEVASYVEHGWVRLNALIDPELAAALLGRVPKRGTGAGRLVVARRVL
jgi:hypothetical protein